MNNTPNVPVRKRETNKKKNNIVRLERIALRECFKNNHQNQNEIKHPGIIDASKSSENVRILAMNVNGYDSKNNRKIEMMQEAMKKYSMKLMPSRIQ